MQYTPFCKFPKEYKIEEVRLQKLPEINDLEGFIKLSNKFRNIFRNNFVNNSIIPYEESHNFFSNLKLDNSRVLYAISLHNEWIGHFGARDYGNKYIVLDNAMRFSPLGGKDLFKKVNLSIINFINQYLDDHKILIVIEHNNTSALKLHEDLDFKECSKILYKKLSIDPSKYYLRVLNNHNKNTEK